MNEAESIYEFSSLVVCFAGILGFVNMNLKL